MSIDIYIAVGVLLQHVRELGQLVLGYGVEVRLIGSKQNAAVKSHLDGRKTVLVGHLLNLGIFHLGLGLLGHLVHMSANDCTGSCSYNATNGSTNGSIASYLTDNGTQHGTTTCSNESSGSLLGLTSKHSKYTQ